MPKSKAKRPDSNAKKAERLLGRDDLADELDIHPDSVKRHHTRANPPPHDRKNGKCFYNAAEYRAWMKGENLDGEQGRPVDGDSPDLEAARLRKENALASKYELQVERERGIVVNKEDYRRHWKRELSLVVSKFRGMGARVAPRAVGKDAGEIDQIISDDVDQVFRELSE